MIKSQTNPFTANSFAILPTTDSLTGRVTDRFSAELVSCEEVLVVDDRSELSPAQAVENRLSRMLSEATMPISHLQMRGMLRQR
ncbi:MAG: hypothetical protein JWN86_3500 [Planctomycetota bacterium]|nr:hypothetical protein [Planctomycetota bacterium]